MKNIKSRRLNLRILYRVYIGLLILMPQLIFAQQTFIENQYIINPWVYNPSRIAERGLTEISLSYKQQWAGIEGAPSIARLGVHSSLNDHVRMGGYVWRQTEGPFQRIEGLATVSYQINLNEMADHNLSFGMSIGVGNRSINRSQLDIPDDPGLSILPASSSYLQGSFGLNYRIKGFRLGIAAPRLIQDKSTGLGGFEKPDFGLPEYLLASISYTWENQLSTFKLEPQLLYHRNQTQIGDQWEGFLTAYYKNLVWGGLSYRQDYGMSAYLGGSYQKIDVTYVYSLPSVGGALPNSSHEIVVRLNFGKPHNSKSQPEIQDEDTDLNDFDSEEDEYANLDSFQKDDQISAELTNPEIPVKDTSNVAPIENKELITEKGKTYKTDSLSTKEQWRIRDLTGMTYPLQVGYYMICGAFASRANALRFETDLEAKGLDITTVMVPSRGLHYVYTGYTDDPEAARSRCDALRQMMGLQDTWILKIYE